MWLRSTLAGGFGHLRAARSHRHSWLRPMCTGTPQTGSGSPETAIEAPDAVTVAPGSVPDDAFEIVKYENPAEGGVVSLYRPGFSQLTEKKMFPLWTVRRTWKINEWRTGLLAIKVGMVGLWNAKGKRIACTVLCVDRCHVVNVQPPTTARKDKRWMIQVAAGPTRPYKSPRPLRYQYASVGVEPKRYSVAFGASTGGLLPPGTELTAMHFTAGQHVDVRGVTKKKGFQGVVKRWGFKGQPRSHGVTKAHRKGGSTGTRTVKTKRGRKMPGMMGGKNCVEFGAVVYKVDGINNLIYVQGPVPGRAGRFVEVYDTRTQPKDGPMYHFPTYFRTGNETAEDLIKTADGANLTPTESQLYFTSKAPLDPNELAELKRKISEHGEKERKDRQAEADTGELE